MDSAPTPPILWARQIRTGSPLRFGRHGISVGRRGEVLLVGRHEGRLDLSALGGSLHEGEPGQLFVLKLWPGGELCWSRTFAAAGERWPWAVAADRDGGCYLAGCVDDEVTLLQLSRAGERVWSRRLTGLVSPARDGEPLALAVDSDDGLVIYGHGALASSVRHPSSGPGYVFAVRLDKTGAVAWKHLFSCSGRGRQPRVAVDQEGGVLFSGYFRGHLEIDSTELSTASRWAAYAAKLDAPGALRWATHVGGADASPIACGMDAAGRIVMGGVFERRAIDPGSPASATWELSVRAFTQGGAPRWERRYPCPPRTRPEVDVAVGKDGSVLLGGTVAGRLDLAGTVVHGEPEHERSFTAKLGASGDLVWCYEMPGPSPMIGMSLHAAPEGGAVIAGSFRGRFRVGDVQLHNEGADLDLCLLRVADAPCEPWKAGTS